VATRMLSDGGALGRERSEESSSGKNTLQQQNMWVKSRRGVAQLSYQGRHSLPIWWDCIAPIICGSHVHVGYQGNWMEAITSYTT
jgi:hypothetical protein